MGFIRIWIFVWWIELDGSFGPIEEHHALCIQFAFAILFLHAASVHQLLMEILLNSKVNLDGEVVHTYTG